MKWLKKGVIFAPDRNFDWMVSHASIPVVDAVSPNVLRIYFGTRDGGGHSHTSYFEVEAERPESILYVHDKPILKPGAPGTFDERGIMPASIVNHQNKKYLYYIGWSAGVEVPYHLAIGLAVSHDDGQSFEKVPGPIADRSPDEPCFNTAPWVIYEGGRWRMWFVSCTGWENIRNHLEPKYHVKYAESTDGVAWKKTGRICIDYDERTGAIGRPCVYRDREVYKMLYSYRGMRGYRNDRSQSYRLGYAESADGLMWTRKDDEVGIERSESGWDSQMMEYCTIHQRPAATYLFYNGNGFGKSGIGYAVQTDPDA